MATASSAKTVPRLLLPVRVETRFEKKSGTAGYALHVRLFPDAVHVNAHDPSLTSEEIETGKAFWRTVWDSIRSATGSNPPKDGQPPLSNVVGSATGSNPPNAVRPTTGSNPPQAVRPSIGAGKLQAAWEDLAARTGPRRAAWVVRALRPDNFDQRWLNPDFLTKPASVPGDPVFPTKLRTRGTAYARPAVAEGLPDQWVVEVYQGNQLVSSRPKGKFPRQTENSPFEPLPLSPKNQSPASDASLAAGVEPLIEDPALLWMKDFGKAIAIGMAVTLDLNPGYDPGRPVDVFVHGICSRYTAAQGAELWAKMLEAHLYSDGLEIVPPGTPTNATGKVAESRERAALLERALAGVDTQPENNPELDGWRLAWAFGLTPGGFSLRPGQFNFAAVAGASTCEERNQRNMNTVLWAPTLEYFLENILRMPKNAIEEIEEIVSGAYGQSFDFPDNIIRPESWCNALPSDLAGLVPLVLGLQEDGFSQKVESLRRWFCDFVRPTGPLATLRIGRQPYGLLPIDTHSYVGPAALLDRLSTYWLTGDAFSRTLRVARPDPSAGNIDALVQTLSMESHSSSLAARSLWQRNSLYFGTISPTAHGKEGSGQKLISNLNWLPNIYGNDPPPPGELRFLFDWKEPSDGSEDHPLNEAADDPDALITRLRNLTGWTNLGSPLFKILHWAKKLEKKRTANRESEFDAALSRLLTEIPKKETVPTLTRLAAGVLDLCTYRMDAWLTARSTQRLQTQRVEAPTGVLLGACGWVEDLKPTASQTTLDPFGSGRRVSVSANNAGFVHAPSLAHGTTAAVLLSGCLSSDLQERAAFSIDLHSSRARLARWLHDGVRAGQSIEALLGYRFERGLHERQVDRLIDRFRKLAPLASGASDSSPMPVVGGRISAVVDGLRLHERWTSSSSTDWQRNPGKVWAALQALDGIQINDVEKDAIGKELTTLADSVDAAGDLLLAESVHQLCLGNPAKAATTLQSLCAGEMPPADPAVLRTPRSGVAHTHRVALLLDASRRIDEIAALPKALGWFDSPRAQAEPRLNAWAAQVLGPVNQVKIEVCFEPADVRLEAFRGHKFQKTVGIEQDVKVDFSLSELRLSPLDVVYARQLEISSAPGGNQPSESPSTLDPQDPLAHQIIEHARGKVMLSSAAKARIEATWVAEPTGRSLQQLLDIARTLRQLFLTARSLQPEDLTPAGTTSSWSIYQNDVDQNDQNDVDNRAEAVTKKFKEAVDILDAALPSQSSLLAALSERKRHGVLDPSAPSAEKSADAALASQASLLAALSDLRWYGMLAPPAPTLEESARTALALARQRLERAKDSNRSGIERLQALFGGEFVVLPCLVVPTGTSDNPLKAAFQEFGGASGPSNEQRWAWLQRVATVREAPATLLRVLTYGEARGDLGQGGLHVAQLRVQDGNASKTQGEVWVAAPPSGSALPDQPRLSLVAYAMGQPSGVDSLAGLLVDEFIEMIPRADQVTALTFHFDRPNAEPPNALLLDVTPSAEPDTAVVRAALRLAKIRSVDYDALGQGPLGALLPALYFPTDEASFADCMPDVPGNNNRPYPALKDYWEARVDKTNMRDGGEIINYTALERLEPRCRLDPEASLLVPQEARVHDPLWFLARQWQLGEFWGDDGGSPLWARTKGRVSRISRFSPHALLGAGQSADPHAQPYNPATEPLEMRVEREAVRIDNAAPPLRFAAESGLHFLRCLGSCGFQAPERQRWVAAYPLPSLEDGLDPEAVRYVKLLRGKVPDGVRLAAVLRKSLAPGGTFPQGLPVASQQANTARQVFQLWLNWYDALLSESGPGALNAWQDSKLEYAFCVAGRNPGSVASSFSTNRAETILVAPEYTEGHLDWYAFDHYEPSAGISFGTTGTPETLKTFDKWAIPAPVRYSGMPALRWWEFEDETVTLVGAEIAPEQLAHLFLLHFSSVAGNDWFHLPIRLPVGSLCLVEALVVTDTFGVETAISPVDPALWSLYRLSNRQANGSISQPKALMQRVLWLPPSLGPILESQPIEEVLFARDEVANLGWAIERRVESPLARGVNRGSPLEELQPPTVEKNTDPATRIYRLRTPVPKNWFPFVAVPLTTGSMELRQGAMCGANIGDDKVQSAPLGRILAESKTLYEEELPREGVRVTRSYQLARWSDGSTHLWAGRKKRPGRGEGWSGLRFDQAEKLPKPKS